LPRDRFQHHSDDAVPPAFESVAPHLARADVALTADETVADVCTRRLIMRTALASLTNQPRTDAARRGTAYLAHRTRACARWHECTLTERLGPRSGQRLPISTRRVNAAWRASCLRVRQMVAKTPSVKKSTIARRGAHVMHYALTQARQQHDRVLCPVALRSGHAPLTSGRDRIAPLAG
jgi:hypothetical protein